MFDWLWPLACVVCRKEGVLGFCGACAPGTVLRPAPTSLGVSGVYSMARYERPAGQALRKAKVSGDRTRLVSMSRLFAARLAPVLASSGAATIVPAPSRLGTRMRRGFAAASVLAHALGLELGLPVASVLRTTAKTKLARLDARARRGALRGRVRGLQDVTGHVLLVDDVLTTGATAEACALELIGGSTDRVTLVTFCVVARPRARC